SVTDDKDQVDRVREFGYMAGMAFQIKDDLFDYGFQNIGKPTGIDIKEKKMTLPLIYTLNKVDHKAKNRIKYIIKRKSNHKKYQREVIQMVKDSGGMEYAQGVMLDYKHKARTILETFDHNDSREALLGLLDFIVDRKK
ncbi:MAG: polyprenyl synthetase family protein, partial [Bacteroidota bacterium]